ncbi:hypothetical protein [Flavonifractor sp. AGMB03687]|uniref:hypothetical protein n=1 Tax=Flavonifractor sp. AGMB03687 TaxID=2785133 RepID=UPI001ADFD23F|nr:hypothetical protein [Flavonifractor sp. AGMB03687]
MKKLLIGAAVTALVLMVGFTTAFAASGRNYVDANGDGVCDNRGTYCQYMDANGDGVCDNYGTHCRNGGTGCRGWGRGCHGGW